MIFKRKSKLNKELSKVERRVKSLPTSELLSWSDTIVYSVGRNLSSWQKSQNQYYLNEAQLAAEALHTILTTLVERDVSGRI